MRLMRTDVILIASLVLVGVLATGASAAPSFEVPTECEIDLEQNTLYNSNNLDLDAVPGGSVFTSAIKKCTVSADRQVILLTCKTKIPTWKGGNQSRKNVFCEIDGTQCGVPQRFTIQKATLSVASDGTARLSCNLSRNVDD